MDQYNHPTKDHDSKVWITLDKISQPGHPNPATDFPTGSVPPHPLERNYSPHPGYPNMPSTGAGPPLLIYELLFWLCFFQALNPQDKNRRRTCTGPPSRPSRNQCSQIAAKFIQKWSDEQSNCTKNSNFLLNTALILWPPPPPAQRWSQLSRNVDIF